MRTQSLLRRLALAVGLSIAALAAAVLVQATLLFPEHFQALRHPLETDICRLSLVADGKHAIALLRHSPRALLHGPQCTLQLCELGDDAPIPARSAGRASQRRCLHRINFDFPPWFVAGASRAQQVFVASPTGDLYCFDPSPPASQPRLLGRHAAGFPVLLECASDGSIVIAGDPEGIRAWSSETAACLWQRSDIRVVGAHFHGPTNRLFCGIIAGPCLELDRFTGATLRTFAAHVETAISLDVSSDGRQLATLDFHGHCTVTDLETGQELWSKRFPQPGVGPRFSPDGRCVLTTAPARAPAVHVLSTITGELRAELRGAKAEIAGIEVTASGIVYAWDTAGTLTAWDLATRSLLRQYKFTAEKSSRGGRPGLWATSVTNYVSIGSSGPPGPGGPTFTS